jgi:ribA/ribD-fused uncharacterized protein
MERITDTHVFFWGSELSNWHPCNFKYKEHIFHNSEQAFMWEKAMYFGDHETASMILACPTPSVAKKLGRKVKNFDKTVWLTAGYEAMLNVNYAKFDQNKGLKSSLLSTENKTIVEASPYDVIWGIGLHWEDDKVLDESQWRGMNLLGKVLMEVREILQ